MLSFSTNITLKQYSVGTFKQILSSQFIYQVPENLIQLKRFWIKIQTRKQKQIHFFYLWLLTNQMPYARKFHQSWKTTSSYIFFKTKSKSHSLYVDVQKKKKFSLLSEILIKVVSKQTISEKKIWTFHQNIIQAMIFFAPLTRNTRFLQMKNAYFPNIPLVLQFQFSNTTVFQKLFFLRSLKILSPCSKLFALDVLN